MKTQSDYFKEVTYKPKYHIGDRVRGLWNNMPFAGSVGVDTLTDLEDGPYVMVFLDLPLKHEEKAYLVIKVKHQDLIKVEGKYGINSKTSNKK